MKFSTRNKTGFSADKIRVPNPARFLAKAVVPNLNIMSRLLIILTVIILTSCGQPSKSDKSLQTDQLTDTLAKFETDKLDHKTEKEKNIESLSCTDFDFNSTEQQADSLLIFMEKAKDSSLTDQIIWKQKFFCAFPNSFKEMQAIFGFDNSNGAAPLYDYPKGANVIQYFSQMESIPDSIYYDKYIKINIDAIWQADNIRGAFGFANKLLEDTENGCKELSKFSDNEIKSVFRFIFDGPHPKNEYNEKLFENLKGEIDRQNKRLSLLLKESYKKLIAENDGHGH